MIHQPKMLYNPTDEKIEVFYNSNLLIFKPKESQMVEGNAAYQILHNQRTGLREVEVVPQVDDPNKSIHNMSYLEIRKQVQELDLWKKDMKKEDMIEVLKQHGRK